MENQTLSPKIEKKIKRTRFDLFDAGYACICFIILQFIISLVIEMFRTEIAINPVLLYIAQFVVEAVFIFASMIVSSSRNVEFVKATTYNKKFDWKIALLAVAISVICIFGFSSLTNVFVYSLEKLSYKSSGSISIPNFGIYVLYVFLMCVVPAVFEETLFRSTILNGMREKGKHYAVLMSALIFMLMHGGPDQTIHQFILGVVLGYVFVYTGSIWVTVLIHFLNNFYAVTAIYIMGAGSAETGAEIAEELPSWGVLALNLMFGIAIASIASYLIYLCIKGMILSKQNEEKKQKEKFDLLLEKETLTEKEIAWLKKYQSQKDEYLVYEKEEQKRKQEKNEAIFGKTEENVVSTSVEEDVQNQTAGSEKNLVSIKPEKKSNVGYVAMLAVSLVWLIGQWVLTLIAGFIA